MIDAVLRDVLYLLLPANFSGFAWPWMLLALPLPVLLRWWLPPVRTMASPALKVPYGRRLDSIAGTTGPARMRGVRIWLAALAWGMLCVAAARPQQLGPILQPPQLGRDLMLAVDVSGSMEAEDMALGRRMVDRLTAAKAVLADFLERRAGDRVGLIVFGQRAFVLTPLTADRDSVRQQLDASVVGLAGHETAIGDAIALAVKRLQAQPEGERVLILLTDGVNTAGVMTPERAARIARDEHVRIYTVALGEAGDSMRMFGIPIPLPGGSSAPVDEAGLSQIADITGGKAYRAADTDELVGIYRQIDRLEPIARQGQTVRPRIERYVWPLAVALLLGALVVAWPGRSHA